jgi:hypothetical protein
MRNSPHRHEVAMVYRLYFRRPDYPDGPLDHYDFAFRAEERKPFYACLEWSGLRRFETGPKITRRR